MWRFHTPCSSPLRHCAVVEAAPPASATGEIIQVEVGLLSNLVEIIACSATSTCALLDPAFEVDRLARIIAARGLTPSCVLLTHTHLDHIEGVPDVLARYGADLPVYVGAGEEGAVAMECARRNLHPNLVPLEGGEVILVGALPVTVIATPGHTRAGRSYYVEPLSALMPGDTLFVRDCGRSDLPGGDARVLYESLMRLSALPEETRVYPGHDYGPTPTSTLGRELAENPCLRCPDAEAFAALRRNPPRP